MARIFLSYAREDEAQVRDVYRRLIDAGFEVWMDKINLLPGQRWQQEIPRAIRSADFILIFFSKHSVAKRGYVQREFRLALETLEEIPPDVIHTIPIRLDDCQIPEEFRHLQWTDLSVEGEFDRIVQALRERPPILVEASLFNTPTDEGDDTHGVKVQVQQGDDLLWKEVDVEVTIANAGRQALQIDCVFIETSTNIFQVTPSGLPVVLDPNRGATVRVQPEFFAPSQFDLITDTPASPAQSVILVGVISPFAPSIPHFLNFKLPVE